ncbi:hypothetical protein [Microcoleus sp. herbarium5]|uniref:hypothetical protein n=1 Tax=Microcoleus sp. herbarium5 TaxID=3055434 RepID=UPI002FD1C0C4
MTFNKNASERVLIAIYKLTQETQQRSVSSFQIITETKVKGQELYDTLNELVDKGYLKVTSSLAGVFAPPQGGSAGVSITDIGLSLAKKLSN